MYSFSEFELRVEELILRHQQEQDQLVDEYLESFATYPVGFLFNHEGRTHKIVSRAIRPAWTDMIVDPSEPEWWGKEDSFGYSPDVDIYYGLDDGVLREGRDGWGKLEPLYLAWRQDFLKKTLLSIPEQG